VTENLRNTPDWDDWFPPFDPTAEQPHCRCCAAAETLLASERALRQDAEESRAFEFGMRTAWQDRAERAEALHVEVADLGRPDTAPWCAACGRTWPCPTARALTGGDTA
jgi:hypothetical protein